MEKKKPRKNAGLGRVSCLGDNYPTKAIKNLCNPTRNGSNPRTKRKSMKTGFDLPRLYGFA